MNRREIIASPAVRLLAAASVILALVVLRLSPTIFHPSLNWGDEIYQAIEPAHRLVYGDGLVTWEFAGRIRSWILPGLIAGIMQVTRLFSLGPTFYLPAIAVCFATLSLVPVIGTFLWCRRVFGAWPALAGAAPSWPVCSWA
jgi:phosphatidylinositol glycan class B